MKNKILGLGLVLVVTGCHSITLVTKDGAKATVKSFGQKTQIGELTYDPAKGVRLKGYNNNQVDALGVIAEGVAKGTAEGLKGVK